MVGKADFLEELEDRLEENRKIVEASWLPRPLHGLASYLGFHTFRSLLVASLILTALMFWGVFPVLMRISRDIFWLK